ncbi:hypothetical protein [Nostoc sp. UHCC 0252]|uniref:hypothetical protein n=1 Tax=Nostoc sp. UHCC 0252 TaxID=3110241 RepID=UPI002B1F70FB|nr:hypothetical protein [Nostoc sp. UHCC 0252]MEA5604156.1 hypothetical protein [Nostoc sp. UHCC 0252]
MNELNDNNKKKAGKAIGSIALLIAIIFVSKNYQDYQNREEIRKGCEQMKVASQEWERIRRHNVGPLEAMKSGKAILIYNGLDCDQIK